MAYALKKQEIERYCIGEEIANLELAKEGAQSWLVHIERTAEKDRVKINANRKRALKEEKKAEKKAAKKAAKWKH